MFSKKSIIFVLFLIFGLTIAGVGYAEITNKTNYTDSHAEHTGTVTNSEVQNATLTGQPIAVDTSTRYRLVVEYEYEVNNETYDGKEILGINNGDKEDLESKLQSKYKEGDSVSVNVDKDSPSKSTLREKSNFTPYSLILIGSVVTIFTLILGNRARKS